MYEPWKVKEVLGNKVAITIRPDYNLFLNTVTNTYF